MNILELLASRIYFPREHVAALRFPACPNRERFRSQDFVDDENNLLLFGAVATRVYRELPVELVVGYCYAGICNFSPLLYYVRCGTPIYGQCFHDIAPAHYSYGALPSGEIALFGWRLPDGPLADLDPLPLPPHALVEDPALMPEVDP